MDTLDYHEIKVNPTGEAIAAADRECIRLGYNSYARTFIREALRADGTAAAATPDSLAAFDEAAVEAAYVAALPPVPYDDESWDDAGVWIDVESIDAAARRVPRSAAIMPPEALDVDDPFADDPYGESIPFLVK